MPQNGIHAMVGVAARKWAPQREWLALGLVLGSMFPDLDNLAVAYATLTGGDTHGLHRTFTHSVFTILAAVILFYIVGAATKNQKWNNFGLGFGAGILMHILVDLVIWFNGVEMFWPLGGEVNFWSWFTVPAWLNVILETGEFLMFGLYFFMLISLSLKNGTDADKRDATKTWAYIELALFIVFLPLFFMIGAKGLPYTIFGALYLVSLIVGMVLTIRMRKTIETV
ncbi:MAG: hypothetical protein DCC56_06155 [Anaerolineae bacterium]|nr:MAG: hypothetical protein DCC56_06155 [Anaerolineae bacterium]WKZ43563.1 MAG: metal-dependent hydrolase [Anaerolineales bacterium]